MQGAVFTIPAAPVRPHQTASPLFRIPFHQKIVTLAGTVGGVGGLLGERNECRRAACTCNRAPRLTARYPLTRRAAHGELGQARPDSAAARRDGALHNQMAAS